MKKIQIPPFKEETFRDAVSGGKEYAPSVVAIARRRLIAHADISAGKTPNVRPPSSEASVTWPDPEFVDQVEQLIDDYYRLDPYRIE